MYYAPFFLCCLSFWISGIYIQCINFVSHYILSMDLLFGLCFCVFGLHARRLSVLSGRLGLVAFLGRWATCGDVVGRNTNAYWLSVNIMRRFGLPARL